MEISKEQKRRIIEFQKVKIGERGDFKVLKLNDDHALCLYLDKNILQAKVNYSRLSNFDIIPTDYLEVGDEFRAEVVTKDRDLLLVIKPLLNLKEIKDKIKLEQKQNSILESWINIERK